jgi:soluble lytic murein transglycosylase-like protein
MLMLSLGALAGLTGVLWILFLAFAALFIVSKSGLVQSRPFGPVLVATGLPVILMQHCAASIHTVFLRLIVAAVTFLIVVPVPASQARNLEPSYEGFISETCERWSVPVKLVKAIARQESGWNAWAVNVAGRGYMPTSKGEALGVAMPAWRSKQSFDVGLMQINSYWLRRFGLSPDYIIEPRRNIVIGVWILSKCLEQYGLTWRAVAAYHTGDPDKHIQRGRGYAASVIKHLRQL